MRTLIISEGSKDNIFLRKLFSELDVSDIDGKIDFFDQNTAATAIQKQHAETDKMRKFGDFDYKEYQYRILVKSEGGKNPALTVFKSLIVHAKRVQMHLLLDLDNKKERDLDLEVDKLKKKIESQLTSRQYRVLRWEDFGKTGNLTTLKAIIIPKYQRRSDARNEDYFYLTYFKTSLETEAGINKKEDSKELKIKKINKFFKTCPEIAVHFKTVFEKSGVLKSLN